MRQRALETKATVQNCVRLYQRLVTLGMRWKMNYRARLYEQKIEVDCVEHLDGITDYIREAHRCLRIDGDLHIWEPASYFDDVKQFCQRPGQAGVRGARTATGAFEDAARERQ